MKRRLLTQMKRNWKSNFWLTIELIIVLSIMIFFSGMLCFISQMHYSGTGYDFNNTYIANLMKIPKSSSEYIPYDEHHNEITDRKMLVERMKNNPNVMAVGIGTNLTPYGDYSTYLTIHPQNGSEKDVYNALCRRLSPDALRAIRLTGLRNESTEQLAQVLERGDIILSDNSSSDTININPARLLGNGVFVNNDSAKIMNVGALAWSIPQGDYEYQTRSGVAYFPLGENDWASEMIIRVKPGRKEEFIKSITQTDKEQGNVVITELQSIDSMRDAENVKIKMIFRIFYSVAFISLLVVFLGFLGTFWFRIQQRAGEIAMRKVAGATNFNIFIRLISEGLILLILSAIIVIPILSCIAISQVTELGYSVKTMITVIIQAVLIALTAMSLLIVGGIWAPAHKAMKIDPATALKDL